MARYSLSFVCHSGSAHEKNIECFDEARSKFYKYKTEKGVRYIVLNYHKESKILMEWYWFKIAEPIECADSIKDVIILGDE